MWDITFSVANFNFLPKRKTNFPNHNIFLREINLSDLRVENMEFTLLKSLSGLRGMIQVKTKIEKGKEIILWHISYIHRHPHALRVSLTKIITL